MTIQELYNATNSGLDILALHFPKVIESVKSGIPFKVRDGERTSSAHVHKFGDVYKIKDFGDGSVLSPLDVHIMKTGLSVGDAIRDLIVKFGLDPGNGYKARSVVGPKITRGPATADQGSDFFDVDMDQEFTTKECEIMGRDVTPDTLKSLNWYRVNSFRYVDQNRQCVRKSSTENYPIFIRECWFDDSGEQKKFYKIYEPNNSEKGYRFQYRPAGAKPPSYINGLFELRRRWTEWNEQERKSFEQSKLKNSSLEYREQKYPEAIICSGERDAVCVRALGYMPIWFNSETYDVTAHDWFEISQLVETVYNIPDIDQTGRRQGAALAMKFIDIKTVWLPDELSDYRDSRGNPCKDFRDFRQHYKSRQDFEGLLNKAAPVKFWEKVYEKKKLRMELNPTYLLRFLSLNGFHSIQDPNSEELKLIKVDNCVVHEVTPDTIRFFVDDWVSRLKYDNVMVANAVLRTNLLSDAMLRRLPLVNLNFSTSSPTSQLLYFQTKMFEITGSKIKSFDLASVNHGAYVWASKQIKCNPKLLPDMFTITTVGDPTDPDSYDIEVHNTDSKYFSYLINSSRLYWRTELEEKLVNHPDPEGYRIAHKFDIAGELLNPAQIHEQKRCLISKIFCIGYLLHRYKVMSRAWAPFAMDNLIDESGRCNGRSGKSFMFTALKHFSQQLFQSGRSIKETNRFQLQQVKRSTDNILFDDCHEYFPYKNFYDTISGDMVVEPKNLASYNVPFDQSPKIIFTTNYVPKDFDPSSTDRNLYLVFSDYYHKQTPENDYLENRSIRDDFSELGMDLMCSTYPAQDWEADANFIMQCIRFYLSISRVPVKIEPDLKNIMYRQQLSEMTENFRDWAISYFSEEGGNLDRELVREEVFEHYKQFSNVRSVTMNRFTRSLKAFVKNCEWVHELNPRELQTSSGRIIRRTTTKYNPEPKVYEMIYLRSVKGWEQLREQARLEEESKQNILPL